MFKNTGLMSAKNGKFSWWWLGVKIGVFTALLVWILVEYQTKQKQAGSSAVEGPDDGPGIPLPDLNEAVEVETTRFEPVDFLLGQEEGDPGAEEVDVLEPDAGALDDLKVIEGIGPKVSATLQAAGIKTYGQLAAKTPDELKQILTDGGVRIGYPATWPEQAALAAVEDWDGLKNLQSTLKGGRRV